MLKGSEKTLHQVHPSVPRNAKSRPRRLEKKVALPHSKKLPYSFRRLDGGLLLCRRRSSQREGMSGGDADEHHPAEALRRLYYTIFCYKSNYLIKRKKSSHNTRSLPSRKREKPTSYQRGERRDTTFYKLLKTPPQ